MNREVDRDRPSTSQVWLDVISAAGYLSKGHRPGFTVYDALAEALRWHSAWFGGSDEDELLPSEPAKLPWDDPDPLRTAFDSLNVGQPMGETPTIGEIIHLALRAWVTRMSEMHNAGDRWNHPLGELRGFVSRID